MYGAALVNNPSTQYKSCCFNNNSRNAQFWSTLTKQDMALLNSHVICHTYATGAAIFMQGDPCEGLFFVERGLIGIRKIDSDGHSYLVHIVGRGEVIGYRPLLSGQLHRAGAEVIEETSTCFVPSSIIRQLLLVNSDFAMVFLEYIAKALGEAEERLFQMATLNVNTRIIHLLVRYHDRWGKHLEDGSVHITVPITRDDLASMIGAHPDSVSRAIRKFKSGGLIKTDGRTFRISEFGLLTEYLQENLPDHQTNVSD